MRRVILVVLALTLTLTATGCVNTIRHSPTDAAAKAEQFLTALIVTKDPDAAYSMLSASARTRVTEEALAASGKNTPGYGAITSIKAESYEPVPGQESIIIHLVGMGGSSPVYYRLQMTGNANTGYMADHFGWSRDPVPDNGARRNLP